MSAYKVGISDADFDDFRRIERAFDDLCTKYLELRAQDDSGLRTYAYQLENECDELTAKLEEQKAELDNLRANYKALSTQNDDLRAQLAHADAIIEREGSRNDELNRVKEVCAEQRAQICDDNNTIIEERAQIRDLAERLEIAGAAYAVLERKFAQLNSEHEGLRVSYEELVHHVDQALAVEPDPAGYENESRAGKLERFARVLKARGDVNVERWNEIHRLRTERDALRTERDRLIEGVAATGDFTYSELRTAYVDFVRAFANIHNAIPREFRGPDR